MQETTAAPIAPGDAEIVRPLTIKQAAMRYGVGERQLRDAVNRGELSFIPWGAHRRLLPETLNAFFRDREQRSTRA